MLYAVRCVLYVIDCMLYVGWCDSYDVRYVRHVKH